MPSGVLDEHGGESLERTEWCTVNHHGRVLCVILGCVLQLEALGQVVVYLNSAQLPTPTDGVFDHEVELRTVKGCLAVFYFGLEALLTTRLDNGLLAFSPHLVRPDVFFCILRVAQADLCFEIIKLEHFEHGLDNVHHVKKLALHLFRAAEDVGIVLCKRANACQSVQLAALFVAIHRTKLGNAQRQVFIRTGFPRKHLAVVRTVHRLEHILFVFFGCMDGLKRIFAVMCIVARCNVEVFAADMWRYHLLIAVLLLNFA